MIGLFAAVAPGCKPGDNGTGNKPADSASSKPSATATATAASGSGDTASAAGSPAKLSEMVKINLPKPPPKAPAGGEWKEVGEVESDGDRQANYTAADKAIWYSLNILDCRHPKAKEVAAKAAGDRGMWQWCFAKPDGKIKDYARLTDDNSLAHGVRAGNIVVVAGPSPTVKDKVGDAEVDQFLGSLDLAAIAKL
jgi:hypothetical protein